MLGDGVWKWGILSRCHFFWSLCKFSWQQGHTTNTDISPQNEAQPSLCTLGVRPEEHPNCHPTGLSPRARHLFPCASVFSSVTWWQGNRLPAGSYELAAVTHVQWQAHRKHTNISSVTWLLATHMKRQWPWCRRNAKEGSILEVRARGTQPRTRGTTARGRRQSCSNVCRVMGGVLVQFHLHILSPHVHFSTILKMSKDYCWGFAMCCPSRRYADGTLLLKQAQGIHTQLGGRDLRWVSEGPQVYEWPFLSFHPSQKALF